MTGPEMLDRLKQHLNRPDADDLFDDPAEYYAALTEAHDKYRRLIATQVPEALYEQTTITDNGNGERYDLPGDHLGEVRVWSPPGPPRGRYIKPAYPGMYRGFYTQGNTIVLNRPRSYDPGLYVHWIPEDTAAIDSNNESTLPAYVDNTIIYWAAGVLSAKTGSLGDPRYWKEMARDEWRGDDQDPTDSGALGTLKNRFASQGSNISSENPDGAWYHRM